MGEEEKPQRERFLAQVVEISRYRSGRHSSRGMPVSVSSCTTLPAGTLLALRHLCTACGQTSSFLANARVPPASVIARSIADFCSMLEVSTVGIPLSTTGSRLLPGNLNVDYRLRMVDISSCDDFADFLTRLMEAEKLDRAAVGKLIGVQRAMVSKYFKKGSKPSDDKLHMIAAQYPVYDFNALHDMVHGKKRDQQDHLVRTEYGARVGRIAESIQDETLRFALLQLISSLERDARKGTGTK